MNEELIKLVTLQKYDKELMGLEAHIKDSQEQIEKDIKRLEKAKEQLEAKEQDVKFQKLESEKTENFIKSAEVSYKEYNYQMMGLKDQKAYDAMKLQLEELKDQISERENHGIEILSRIEELNKTIAVYQEKINEEEKRIEKTKSDLAEEVNQRSEEKSGLKVKRDEYAKHIDAKLLAQYEKLLLLPKHQALAELDDRTCTGCYSTITRDALETIKLQERIVTCDSCGRILYIPSSLGVEQS